MLDFRRTLEEIDNKHWGEGLVELNDGSVVSEVVLKQPDGG